MFSCTQCAKRFGSERALKDHMRKKNTIVKAIPMRSYSDVVNVMRALQLAPTY